MHQYSINVSYKGKFAFEVTRFESVDTATAAKGIAAKLRDSFKPEDGWKVTLSAGHVTAWREVEY